MTVGARSREIAGSVANINSPLQEQIGSRAAVAYRASHALSRSSQGCFVAVVHSKESQWRGRAVTSSGVLPRGNDVILKSEGACRFLVVAMIPERRCRAALGIMDVMRSLHVTSHQAEWMSEAQASSAKERSDPAKDAGGSAGRKVNSFTKAATRLVYLDYIILFTAISHFICLQPRVLGLVARH